MKGFFITAALAACVALSGCATSTRGEPSWSQLPSGDAMVEAYPVFASLMGQRGRAMLICRVEADGRLSECEVHNDQPEGLGFDRAALQLASNFVAAPSERVGRPRVAFTVDFDLDETPRPAWTGSAPSEQQVLRARQVFGRYMPTPLQMYGDLDVDDDRRAWVTSLVVEAETELLDERLDAMGLAWARLYPPETIELLSRGQRMPPPTDPDLAWSAEDGLNLVEDRLMDILRTRYCARYSCVLR